MNYGERIKRYREQRGMSQAELARRSGIRGVFLSRIENGKRGFDLEEAVKIARALGISIGMLAGESDADEAATVDELMTLRRQYEEMKQRTEAAERQNREMERALDEAETLFQRIRRPRDMAIAIAAPTAALAHVS